MKLNHLRDVIAIAERGSLRSAARQLGLAQPAITRSIRELEHELGVSLFERRVSGMILTPMGKAFPRRAVGIQRELQRTRDEIEQLKGKTTGSLAVGLSTAPHLALLPRVIEPFLQRFPGVHLRICEGLFPTMEADIQDGTIDFYVGPLTEDFQAAELTAEKLFDNQRIVVGRKGHPLGLANSLSELTKARWVTTSVTLVGEAELNPLFERLGLPLPAIAVRTETALSMIVVAAASDLLAILPQQWLDFIATTQLVQHIVIKEDLVAPPICIVRRARLPLTPAAEHLSDLFRRAAANHIQHLPWRAKAQRIESDERAAGSANLKRKARAANEKR